MAKGFESLCPGCFREKPLKPVCVHCDYDELARRGPLLLPHRILLREQYLIGRVLGKPGGFGMTYLAFDIGLETPVAIKEYLPRDLAGRDSGELTVSAHSPEEGELFRLGLAQFLAEARTLAKFDHAHIVRVRQVFEAHGTAYLVMDYYLGQTLDEYLESRGGKLPEKTALEILMPILDGLREVHEQGFIHRDIKPQNIYLTTQGRPILLDFGAARLAVAERSRSLSVMLTPGYAPFEQYRRRGKQGPWTDVYACAAVLYRMVTGITPPEAPDRMDEDLLEPPSRLEPSLSPSVVEALMVGLNIKAGNRPGTVREFQNLLPSAKASDTSEPRTLDSPMPSPAFNLPKPRHNTTVSEVLYNFARQVNRRSITEYEYEMLSKGFEFYRSNPDKAEELAQQLREWIDAIKTCPPYVDASQWKFKIGQLRTVDKLLFDIAGLIPLKK